MGSYRRLTVFITPVRSGFPSGTYLLPVHRTHHNGYYYVSSPEDPARSCSLSSSSTKGQGSLVKDNLDEVSSELYSIYTRVPLCTTPCLLTNKVYGI